MSRFLWSALLLFPLAILGCESNSQTATQPPAKATEQDKTLPVESTGDVAKNPAATVTLDIKNWDETLALVAEHKGKVVVLDLWSTSCDPCMV
ncbi:MAG: hypothetical protein DWI21_13930, partial [Planctomycetota bacterium]